MVTTIQIQDETWELLNKAKKKGETFDDVLKRKLNNNLNKKEDKK